MGLTHELSNVAEISGVSPADPLAAPRYFSSQQKRGSESLDIHCPEMERRKNMFKSQRQSCSVLSFLFCFVFFVFEEGEEEWRH